MTYRKYFITYGDHNYSIQRKRISFQAKQFKIFDKVIPYKFKSIDKSFISRYKNVFKYKTGGGYWLWKIYIILETFKLMNEGDILIYVDAGSSLNLSAKNRLLDYFEILNKSNKDLLFFELSLVEKNWTTNEVFKYFNVEQNNKIINSNQYMGGVLLAKKNDRSIKFFNEILLAVDTDYKLITDYYSSNQTEYFKACRHDQSLMSVLAKKNDCLSLKDETFFYLNPEIQFSYPILTVRDGRYTLWQKIKYYSLYPINIRKVIYWQQEPYYFKNKYTNYLKVSNKLKKMFNKF